MFLWNRIWGSGSDGRAEHAVADRAQQQPLSGVRSVSVSAAPAAARHHEVLVERAPVAFAPFTVGDETRPITVAAATAVSEAHAFPRGASAAAAPSVTVSEAWLDLSATVSVGAASSFAGRRNKTTQRPFLAGALGSEKLKSLVVHAASNISFTATFFKKISLFPPCVR